MSKRFLITLNLSPVLFCCEKTQQNLEKRYSSFSVSLTAEKALMHHRPNENLNWLHTRLKHFLRIPMIQGCKNDDLR